MKKQWQAMKSNEKHGKSNENRWKTMKCYENRWKQWGAMKTYEKVMKSNDKQWISMKKQCQAMKSN